ncbi:conserved hypothetical protein, partial [Ricinus communis]
MTGRSRLRTIDNIARFRSPCGKPGHARISLSMGIATSSVLVSDNYSDSPQTEHCAGSRVVWFVTRGVKEEVAQQAGAGADALGVHQVDVQGGRLHFRQHPHQLARSQQRGGIIGWQAGDALAGQHEGQARRGAVGHHVAAHRHRHVAALYPHRQPALAWRIDHPAMLLQLGRVERRAVAAQIGRRRTQH